MDRDMVDQSCVLAVIQNYGENRDPKVADKVTQFMARYVAASGGPCRSARFASNSEPALMRFRTVLKAALGVVLICPAASSLAADTDDDSDGDKKPTVPTMYLDLRTYYAQIPAGSLAFGFGHPSFFTALPTLTGSNSAALSTGLPRHNHSTSIFHLRSMSPIASRSTPVCPAVRRNLRAADGLHLTSQAGISVSRPTSKSRMAGPSRP
ncbi:hypothetical protein [Bradyrhizobium liaoningense]